MKSDGNLEIVPQLNQQQMILLAIQALLKVLKAQQTLQKGTKTGPVFKQIWHIYSFPNAIQQVLWVISMLNNT